MPKILFNAVNLAEELHRKNVLGMMLMHARLPSAWDTVTNSELQLEVTLFSSFYYTVMIQNIGTDS